MKILIEMAEEKYEWLKKNNQNADPNSIVGAVTNGTPLPKGHGDLIDRKELGITPIDSTDLPAVGCLMVYLAEDVEGAPIIIEADKVEENNKE